MLSCGRWYCSVTRGCDMRPMLNKCEWNALKNLWNRVKSPNQKKEKGMKLAFKDINQVLFKTYINFTDAIACDRWLLWRKVGGIMIKIQCLRLRYSTRCTPILSILTWDVYCVTFLLIWETGKCRKVRKKPAKTEQLEVCSHDRSKQLAC